MNPVRRCKYSPAENTCRVRKIKKLRFFVLFAGFQYLLLPDLRIILAAICITPVIRFSPDLIEPLDVFGLQDEIEGKLYLVDESFHGKSFSRLDISKTAQGVSFPLGCNICRVDEFKSSFFGES